MAHTNVSLVTKFPLIPNVIVYMNTPTNTLEERLFPYYEYYKNEEIQSRFRKTVITVHIIYMACMHYERHVALCPRNVYDSHWY